VLDGAELVLDAKALGACTLVGVQGDLDLSTAPQLQRCLNALDDVILDLRPCRFMDSMGVSVLLTHWREHRLEVICAANGATCRVLKLLLAGVVTLHEDLPSAIAAMSSQPDQTAQG
jgi:anti-anti-sigma factor